MDQEAKCATLSFYLENETFVYQVFIEPKDDFLEKQDSWNQGLLYTLNGEDDPLHLLGLKLYNSTNQGDFVQ